MIGSHNTMTYLPVEKWWMKPLNIFAKCQNKYLYSQYIHGVRCYDMRVYLKDNNYWKFCHGIINYKSILTIYDVINEINSFDNEEFYIRFVLEKGNEFTENEFAKLCAELESKYPKIKFFGGVRKRDWKELYHFKNNPDIEQYISSMSRYWFIPPWIYAKLFNKKNFSKINNSKINLFDFI